MSIINLKRVSDREVRMWLEDNIKDLSPYQKEYIRDELNPLPIIKQELEKEPLHQEPIFD